ncbi:MAG TPA: acyltransferase, partial [Ilumatobacteraceae bacterium]
MTQPITDKQPERRNKRIPELDGLRAIAVIPVIAYHFGYGVNGRAGVTVFFALSGYIVTTLLLGELHRTGGIGLRDFYVRRIRRLIPAASTVVLATVIVGRILHKPPVERDAIASLTYWENIQRFASHFAYGQSNYAPLEHFWSLAMEEQFYLVLPLVFVLIAVRSRRWFLTVVLAGLVSSAVFATLHTDQPQMYFHPLARVCELLAGVALALIGKRLSPAVGAVALIALLAILSGFVTPAPIIVALVTCVVIAGRPRVLAWAPLVLIGTFSYGLYLWHPLAAVIAPNVIVRVVLTAAFAVTSYYVIERPLRTTVRKPRALFLVACTSVVALLFAVFMPVQSTQLRFAAVAPVVAAAPELPTTTTTAPVATTTTTTIATNASPPAADGSVPATTDLPATTAPTTTTAAAPRTLRISGVGDSTQMFLDGALESWAATYPQDITWVKPPDAIVPWTSGADNWIRDFAPGAGLSLPTDGPQGGLDRQGCPLIYDVPIRPNSQWGYFDSSTLHSSTPIASCDWHNWV